MKTKNIITAVALADLLVTALTLSARCALALATETTAVKSTEGQSETEPSDGVVKQNDAKTTASTDPSITAKVEKFRFASKPSPFSSFTEAEERESTEPQKSAPANEDAQELAKKLANPVASLISVPCKAI